jgi:hypothetical protein
MSITVVEESKDEGNAEPPLAQIASRRGPLISLLGSFFASMRRSRNISSLMLLLFVLVDFFAHSWSGSYDGFAL